MAGPVRGRQAPVPAAWGCSTGPKTAEGRARIAESNRRRAQQRDGHTVPLTPLFPK